MTTVITQVESRRPLYLQEQWVIIMTSSNMVLRKTASYFRLVIRGQGDSHFQIGQLRLLRRRCIVLFNILEGFSSRIDENHWLLHSPICSESSRCYLRTSIQATIAIQIAQVFTVRQRKTRERGIPFYWRNLISFDCISWAAAPFLPATDADLQRFYKEYFVDSDSEDDGILFKRRMFVRGQFIW